MTFATPNFVRRRQKLEVIEFLPVKKAFKPQRLIRMKTDISGWVSQADRRKWSLSDKKEYAIDEDKAREFVIKGYAEPIGWKPVVSEDEKAEMLSSVTTISLGG